LPYIFLGEDWPEFLELLSRPLDYELAFEQLAAAYLGQISISRGMRAVYWDALINLTMVCHLINKKRRFRALMRGFYLITNGVDRKIKERFNLTDTPDIGVLDTADTVRLLCKRFRECKDERHMNLRHSLALGIYGYVLCCYVEFYD
jgi:hypothetical protein